MKLHNRVKVVIVSITILNFGYLVKIADVEIPPIIPKMRKAVPV